MDKDIGFTDLEWRVIYTSVYREYKRQYSKAVKGKMLNDDSAQKWQHLLLKILAHIDCDELDKKSRN